MQNIVIVCVNILEVTYNFKFFINNTEYIYFRRAIEY